MIIYPSHLLNIFKKQEKGSELKKKNASNLHVKIYSQKFINNIELIKIFIHFQYKFSITLTNE